MINFFLLLIFSLFSILGIVFFHYNNIQTNKKNEYKAILYKICKEKGINSLNNFISRENSLIMSKNNYNLDFSTKERIQKEIKIICKKKIK